MYNSKENKRIAEFMGMAKTDLGWYDCADSLKGLINNPFDYIEWLKFDEDINWVKKVYDRLILCKKQNNLILELNELINSKDLKGSYQIILKIIKNEKR